MKAKTSPKRGTPKTKKTKTVEEVNELTRDLVELKEYLLPALSRICSNYEALIEENKILRNALEEVNFDRAEIDSLHSANAELTAQYITAKSLINIPDNIAGLVEELIKTRLLVWDKSIVDITANPEEFDSFPELNRAFSKKGKKNTKTQG